MQDLHAAVVAKSRHGLHFAPEAFPGVRVEEPLGSDHLDRDIAIQGFVAGKPNEPHATTPEATQEPVGAEAFRGGGAELRKRRGRRPQDAAPGQHPEALAQLSSDRWPICAGPFQSGAPFHFGTSEDLAQDLVDRVHRARRSREGPRVRIAVECQSLLDLARPSGAFERRGPEPSRFLLVPMTWISSTKRVRLREATPRPWKPCPCAS